MKATNKHEYVLIMAGGSGSRLYPRSTSTLPKQFQKIIGEKTLIEQTYDRVIKIVDNNHIYVSSNHKYIDLIKKHLPDIPVENYITEPIKRNTGPAIALATALIYKKDKDAIITVIHSDHLVVKINEYVKAIRAGIKAIKKNPKNILCIGITPTSAHTGLGYIEKNKKYSTTDGYTIFNTKRFVEKPNLDLAKEYVASGKFLWNAGYFIWQAKYFLSELKKHDLSIYNRITKISKKWGKKDFLKTLNTEFVKFKSIAVDHMIMEKTSNLLVLPVDIGWSDVGSWDVVADMVNPQNRDPNGNYAEGTVVTIDTHNTTILSHNENKIIATVGLDNFIIITTDDAVVIVPKGRSEDVAKIVLELSESGINDI